MNSARIAELLDLDRKHLWHPYASMIQPPPVNLAERAHGAVIRLADGTELLDALSSWWCMCHGHNHPAIVGAVRKQTEKLSQIMFAGFTHEPAVRLGQMLSDFLPGTLNRVFFADSGSVSVECAVKLAMQYQIAAGHPDRIRMATVRGGYHGDTTGCMALSDPDGMHAMFRGLLPKHFFAPRPEICYGETWNDSDFVPMETMLREHASEIAGVILEPVFQGAGSMRFYHPEYLKKLRTLCTELDLVLIFDEVATGFGRLGTMFAMEYPGVVPDVVCVGKGLTGGTITLAAVVASDRVADVVSDGGKGKFMHGPTFMASPLACAAGCASLELFGQYDWRTRVASIERIMREELAPLRNCSFVRSVRVLGAVGVVELDSLPSPGTVQEHVLETGVWLRPFGSWLYAMPPYVSTDEEVRRMARALVLLAEKGPF